MISTRYLTLTCILLALALIPTTIHIYINAKFNDGRSVKNISTTLNSFSSVPTNRNDSWGEDIFGSSDWFERIYQKGVKNTIRLFAARGYDHKRLYHHPELALSYAKSLHKIAQHNLPNHNKTPVHVFSNDDNSLLVAYILLYDNEFIANPINHQLSESIRLLFNSRKLMTLFYASETIIPGTQFEQSDLAPLLSLAIQSFQSQTKN